MRTLHELDRLKVSEWTEEEALFHLTHTFDAACRMFPDIMEPWIPRVDGTTDRLEKLECMRLALRSTFRARYPQ
jgi:hypothetical protein